MSKPAATGMVALFGMLLLGGCAYNGPNPGAADNVYNNHTTAAGGWGLGPQDFNSNGGGIRPRHTFAVTFCGPFGYWASHHPRHSNVAVAPVATR